MAALFEHVTDSRLTLPLPRLEYREAMDRYGTDRPDLRFGMEIVEITDLVKDTDFKVLQQVLEGGGTVKAIRVQGGATAFSRKMLDELSGVASREGARGLLWAKVGPEGWQSSLSKFLHEEKKGAVNERLGAGPDDLLLIVADQAGIANRSLGLLRLEIARRLELTKPGEHALVWVTRFPLMEYNEEERRLEAVHHPFTAPLEEDLSLLRQDPNKVRARSYDIVLNGSEIGGGSVRIHNLALQEEMFSLLGISREEADRKFGFFLEALKYGAPPHAGIALGFDRLVAILAGVESIREVIAFPKTASATCPLTDAPSTVDAGQLEDLGLGLLDDHDQRPLAFSEDE
jgi:aspartyl-tRNA synthetase